MKVYTKKGDTGKTDLYDGSRVNKFNYLLKIVGKVDELISFIGVEFMPEKVQDQIMSELMCFNTWLATPKPKNNKQKRQLMFLPNVNHLENDIDLLSDNLNLKNFILPKHKFHIYRAKVREVERLFWKYGDKLEYKPNFLGWGQYLNRLSDYFFILACLAQQSSGNLLTTWSHPIQ